MRIVLPLLMIAGLAGCPKKPDNFDADAKSGPDGRRTGAKQIMVNTPITDEVNYKNQDKTDWFNVNLIGKPGILTTKVNWDNGGSDLQIDVFDEFGKQISASPARTGQAKDKTLLTQIDRIGQYFIRITAPNSGDGTVYTMEAKWEVPKAETPVTLIQPEPDPEPVKPRKEPRHKDPVEKPEKPAGDTLQGRIQQAYNDGDGMVLHIDKGSANGIKKGMTGAVLSGSSGEDPAPDGDFTIFQVVGPNKSLARAKLRSLGKHNRVMINLGK